VLKEFIHKMAETLDVMSKRCVVHADLKPDNILIDFDGKRILDIKLIDFGSSFLFSNQHGSKITASTPEYLAPEVLNFLDQKNSSSQGLCSFMHAWSYDMWSLGAILLEIVSGFPIWMSLKCRTVPVKGRS
jgi:hypothetical protein